MRVPSPKNYYQFLGIDRSASRAVIRKAFESLQAETAGDSVRAAELREAYECLTNTVRRHQHDLILDAGTLAGGPSAVTERTPTPFARGSDTRGRSSGGYARPQTDHTPPAQPSYASPSRNSANRTNDGPSARGPSASSYSYTPPPPSYNTTPPAGPVPSQPANSSSRNNSPREISESAGRLQEMHRLMSELDRRQRLLEEERARIDERETELSLRESKLALERTAPRQHPAPSPSPDPKLQAELARVTELCQEQEAQLEALQTAKQVADAKIGRLEKLLEQWDSQHGTNDEVRLLRAELERKNQELAARDAQLPRAQQLVRELKKKLAEAAAEQGGRSSQLDWRANNLKEREDQMVLALEAQAKLTAELRLKEQDLQVREQRMTEDTWHN